MSSRKPQGAVERLPADFEEPRQHQMSPTSKLGADLGPLLHTAPETRFDAVRAVTLDHNRTPETPETIAEAGVVLGALGLLDVDREAAE